MATRASNNNNSTVRKNVTPSSNSRITPKPTNIRPATTASSAAKVKTTTTTTTTSGKSVPNHLKPTGSSRPESTNLAKKNINEEYASQKLIRRRSFDKPPSTTKSLISPIPKEIVVYRDRRLPIRSSSFSPSSVSSSQSSSRIPTSTTKISALDRNSKSLKHSKPQPGSIRRSSSFTRTTSLSKNNSNASHSSKGSNDPHNAIQDLDVETKQESDKESSSVQESEVTVLNVDREEEIQSDMQKAENKEDVDGEDEEVKPSEISVVAEEPKVSEEDSNGSELHEDEVEEEKNHSDNQSEEGMNADEAKSELTDELDKGEENTNGEEKFKADSSEEAVEDEKKKEESEEVKCKEGEDVVVVEDNGEEEEEANAVQQKRQVVQGKKESPAPYNDVIEETKNKLLEKRKNKVKALVGAFETVIDYETAGSNK